jgi:hypothetical protein
MVTDLDLGWFAGIVDGEGCITIINPGHQREKTAVYTPLIVVGSTSVELIVKVARIGRELSGSLANVASRNGPPGHKAQYDWQVASRKAVCLAEKLLPHLTAKLLQAEILVDYYHSARQYGRGSYPGDEEMARRRMLAEKIRELNGGRNPIKYS